MKNILLLLCILLMNSAIAQNVHWAGALNMTYNDNIYDLQSDKDNNLVICGQFSGTVDFDHGPGVANMTAAGAAGEDIFVAKYDSVGNYLWSFKIGNGFYYDECDRIAIDTSGNIFITGMWNGTVDFDPDPINVFDISSNNNSRSRFLAKYDPSGNFIAAKNVGDAVGSLPSSQDGQSGLACDADGNVYMSGFYGTSMTIGPGVTLPVSGLSDNYFSKFNAQLDLNWAYRIGSNETEYSQGIYVSPEGKIILLGSFRNTVDFDPGPLTYNLTQISSTQEGYFAEYDSAGQFLFVKQLSAGTSTSPIATFIDSHNHIIVAGSCAGTLDADPGPGVAPIGIGFNDQGFVASYDSLGNYRWAFAYGDPNTYNAIRYAAPDSEDNIYVAGTYNPLVDINPSADTAILGNYYGDFIASYDSSGNFRNAFLLQDAKMRLKNNDIYATGYFYGLVDFDPGPQLYPLQSDTANTSLFLMRMHPCDNFSTMPQSINSPLACAGDTMVFNVSPGGQSYQWELSAGLLPVSSLTGDSILVIANTAATTEYVYVYTEGGCQNSPMIYTTVNVNYPVTPEIVLSTSFDTLLTQIPYVTYQWFFNGAMIPNATDSFYFPMAPGWFMVLVTDSGGCDAISDSILFTPEGIADVEMMLVEINPVIFKDEFTVNLNNTNDNVNLIVTDLTGRVLYENKINGNQQVIQTSKWIPGVYIVSLKAGKQYYRKRMIKSN